MRGPGTRLYPLVPPLPVLRRGGTRGSPMSPSFESSRDARGVAPPGQARLRKGKEPHEAAPQPRLPAWISRGASCPAVHCRTALTASPLRWLGDSPSVPGTRLYPLVPPLPVLSEIKSDHLLSAVKEL